MKEMQGFDFRKEMQVSVSGRRCTFRSLEGDAGLGFDLWKKMQSSLGRKRPARFFFFYRGFFYSRGRESKLYG